MKHKVIIRKCAEYDADKIAGIIREGMQDLGAIPRGNILLKPNTVIAHPEIFPVPGAQNSRPAGGRTTGLYCH